MAAVEAPEVGDALLGLEAGDVEVEVHPVDAFELEGDVFAEDFGDGLWYLHGGLRGWTSGHNKTEDLRWLRQNPEAKRGGAF